MEILDRNEIAISWNYKPWMVIFLANISLVGVIFYLLEITPQGTGELIIVGLGTVSIIFINPIITLILLFFTKSDNWKKWCIASAVVTSMISIASLFYFVF
ncbi:hypothetical protein [Bernardetia sp.]|uniref:hypothetical protein n=1 Tax=Bernardetia sp. TaxID=1937974 RepID=UPI0025C23BE2|nr:hypothetical protein [Bernardetia sp.]